jgi:iron complex outermembrane receptor protein
LRYYNDDNDKIKTDKVLGMDDGSSPEKSLKFINEVDFSRDKNDLKITLFSNYILNYVFERPIGLYGTIRGPMPYFVFDQSDIVLVGSDLYFQRKFSTKFKSSLRLNYLWSQNLIKNGKMINQPPIRIANNLMWNTKDFWKINHSEISISPSYTFRQFQSPMIISPDELISGLIDVNLQSDIFDFKDAPDGYFLIDFAWKFKIADFSASVEVKNLLNKKYRNYLNEMRYFADEMGRNFLFNISYRISKK